MKITEGMRLIYNKKTEIVKIYRPGERKCFVELRAKKGDLLGMLNLLNEAVRMIPGERVLITKV